NHTDCVWTSLLSLHDALPIYVGAPGKHMPACMGGMDPQTYAAASPAQRRMVDLIRRLAPDYGVNPRLALAVARTESGLQPGAVSDRKSTRLNSSHVKISYAVF